MPRVLRLPPPESLPADLQPLAIHVAQPYATLPLDVQQARSAIWYASGNIKRAADLLGVSAPRLLNFVKKDPYLERERSNAADLLVDQAEGIVQDSLDDPNTALESARWVLERRGAERGWNSPIKPTVNPAGVSFGGAGTSGKLAIQWESD
jgi:hypothetical protein